MVALIARLRGRPPPTKLHYADPLRAGRHPFQTYLLALCVVTGIPQLLGQDTSQSVEEVTPAVVSYGWALALVVGSAAALAGSYWPWRSYATALTLERAGLAVTGYAALIYAAAIVGTTGISRGVAAGIILAFGASCLRRSRDIGHVFRRAIDMTAAGGDRLEVAVESETSKETEAP